MSDIDKISQALGRIEANIEHMRLDIKEIKPIAYDWRNTKNKGIGVISGVALLGGAIGAKISHIFSSLFHG